MKRIDPSYTGGATFYKVNPWGVVNKTSVTGGVVLVLSELADDIGAYKHFKPYVEATGWGALVGGAFGGFVGTSAWEYRRSTNRTDQRPATRTGILSGRNATSRAASREGVECLNAVFRRNNPHKWDYCGCFRTAGTITLGNQARRLIALVHSACETVYITRRWFFNPPDG